MEVDSEIIRAVDPFERLPLAFHQDGPAPVPLTCGALTPAESIGPGLI